MRAQRHEERFWEEELQRVLTHVAGVLLAELLHGGGVEDAVVELQPPAERVDEAHADAHHPAPAALRVVVLPDGGRYALLGARQPRCRGLGSGRWPFRTAAVVRPSVLRATLWMVSASSVAASTVGPALGVLFNFIAKL